MSQTLTNLIYHIVFSTKKHDPYISEGLTYELYKYIGGIIRGEKGIMLNMGGTTDHIHILAKIPPTISISDILKRIKGNSSKWCHDEKRITFAWQRGYGAFSVSESAVKKVSEYINNQTRHHEKMTFKEEYLLLLKRHNVVFDEKFLWD